MSAHPPSCPNCDAPLQPVTARARTGYLLVLDQCGGCGGLWCDRWELFPIDTTEVNRLDPIDQPALWAPVATVKRDLKCPRCSTALQRFHDPVLPADARIERCPACEGMWLNRGELRRFKAGRGQLPPRPALSDAAIQSLLGRYAKHTNWPTVTHLDTAADGAPPVQNDSPSDITSQLMWSAVWLGARTLVRLLLHL